MTSTSDFSACPASEAILTTNKMTMRENISRSIDGDDMLGFVLFSYDDHDNAM